LQNKINRTLQATMKPKIPDNWSEQEKRDIVKVILVKTKKKMSPLLPSPTAELVFIQWNK